MKHPTLHALIYINDACRLTSQSPLSNDISGLAMSPELTKILQIDKICIWYPFECDMGLDGTLTSHIKLVFDLFDMACQSAI